MMTMLIEGTEAVMTLQINITANGRMSLPADVRKRLGLTGGGAVYLDETEDGVVLRTASQAVAIHSTANCVWMVRLTVNGRISAKG